MMVPRAYQYSASLAQSPPSERTQQRQSRDARVYWNTPKRTADVQPRPLDVNYEQTRTVTKPVAVPNARERKPSSREYNSLPVQSRRTTRTNRRGLADESHDPNALPPAVAALLAVTAIPPRRSNGVGSRRKARSDRRMSIDELMHEWRNDGLVNESLGTSPVLTALLEEVHPVNEQSMCTSIDENPFLHTRSTSCESIPSLDGDAHSLLSTQSPSTPGSIRSRRSLNNLKRDKARSLPVAEACASDHPLVQSETSATDEAFETLFMASSEARPAMAKSRSSFRSNLTSSLQALKTAALNSITSLSRSHPSLNVPRTKSVAPFSDDMLWSHPFLFPHYSSEVRPQVSGSPTEAERRYLNPMPLTFEEQEAPFQQALHAPYLAQGDVEDGGIPMQTYTRSSGRRKSRNSTASEAGRVLLGAYGVRQREPRENSDFLRVVVLEMNMRRQGKIEGGRAKIWLPPREPVTLSVRSEEDGHDHDDSNEPRLGAVRSPSRPRRRVIPKRWRAISAY